MIRNTITLGQLINFYETMKAGEGYGKYEILKTLGIKSSVSPESILMRMENAGFLLSEDQSGRVYKYEPKEQ